MKDIFEAFAERDFKEYDAFMSVIKDTIAPTDNDLAYKVEDDANAMLSEMFTKIENKYNYEGRKSYLLLTIKNAILMSGTLTPIGLDKFTPIYCGEPREEHVTDVYLDDDGIVCVATTYTLFGETKHEYTRCADFGNSEIEAIAKIVGVAIEDGKTARKRDMAFNHLYFVKASAEWNESIVEYYNRTPYNYVIIERGQVLTWDDGNPIIYGDKGDAINEIEKFDKIDGISIITEREFIDTYCSTELYEEMRKEEEERKKEEEIMDAYNGHNASYVDMINEAWRTRREEFCPILCALYRRDIDEITNHDAFMEPKWLNSEEYRKGCDTKDWEDYFKLVLKDMETEWDFWAYSYLKSIADDEDLLCILNYLHYER